MSTNTTKDFFKKKHTWSIIKDSLLSWYLMPYLSKMMTATSHLYLIDGFAGPGLFEDGQKGSPLIEAELLDYCLQKTSNKKISVHLICIEKDKRLFEKLKQNTKAINYVECLNDSVEDSLPKLLNRIEKHSAVFLYLDPFGIKGLPTNLDSFISQRKDLKIELLLNFNSFGCYRECKRLIGDTEFDTFFEENPYLLDDKSTPQRMDALLGSEEWRTCINEINHEYLLSYLLCEKYKKTFKYALNMPVKNIKNDVIKYRMVHCSNSASGAILMADNMFVQMNKSKISLFNTDLEGNIVEVNDMIPRIIDYIPMFPDKPIRLNELLMLFYEKIGVICPSKDLKDYLRKKETAGIILVNRSPSITSTGKKTAFWSEDNGKTIRIVRKISI